MQTIIRSRRIAYTAMLVAMLVTLTSIAQVSAQPTPALVEDWRSSDYSYSSRMMDTDLNDNIYVLGDTTVGDYLVIKKFSPAGNLLWQTTYDPTNRLRGVWITVDNDNSPVVIASIITGSNADPAGWLTLKYDTGGNLLWANNLPGPFYDARRVEIDANNDIYVTGRMWLSNPSGNTTHDSVLIKYDPDGGTLWTAVFDNNSAMDEPYSLVISPDNSLIGVAGKSGNLFMALMYDPNGTLLWSNTDTSLYPANDLVFGPGNISYFATGTYDPIDPNPYQMAIAKFDAMGNQSWVQSYSVGYRTFRLGVDSQDNILATGIDVDGYMDWMTIKTDPNGNLLWWQRYDGGKNNDETPNMLAIDSFDAVYVTGKGGPNPGSGNISYLKGVVVKYNSDGVPQWAVWDEYANGKAFRFGSGDSLATLAWGYLVTTHYTQTGLSDIVPAAPTYLSGYVDFNGSNYLVNLSFVDNAINEFWVDIERCTGSGCTDFSKIGQTLGENATSFSDENVSFGVTYTYRVRAQGFMGASDSSNTIEVVVNLGDPPVAPSNLTAEMDNDNVVLNWQDNSNNESQFYIERCQGEGCTNFTSVGMTDADITTWTDYNPYAGESYSYRVRAWNSNGFSDYSNTVTIVIPYPPNTAPLLDFIGDRSVDELTTLVFTATATDLDVPPQVLTFSLGAGAPAGANIDPTTGIFSWTPDEEQGPGVYPVTVIVTDDGIPPLSDQETFNITVNDVNQNPVVNAGLNQTVQEAHPVQFSGTFTDTDGLLNPLAEAMILWDFGDGMKATGTLTPTHSYGDNGVFTVTLVVTDTMGGVGQDTLEITATNVAPSLDLLPDQTTKINQLVEVPVTFTDPGWLDSHTVAVTWMPGVTETLNLVAGITNITFQHTYTQVGQYPVTVTVTDHDGSFDSRTFMIIVEAYILLLPLIQR